MKSKVVAFACFFGFMVVLTALTKHSTPPPKVYPNVTIPRVYDSPVLAPEVNMFVRTRNKTCEYVRDPNGKRVEPYTNIQGHRVALAPLHYSKFCMNTRPMNATQAAIALSKTP